VLDELKHGNEARDSAYFTFHSDYTPAKVKKMLKRRAISCAVGRVGWSSSSLLLQVKQSPETTVDNTTNVTKPIKGCFPADGSESAGRRRRSSKVPAAVPIEVAPEQRRRRRDQHRRRRSGDAQEELSIAGIPVFNYKHKSLSALQTGDTSEWVVMMHENVSDSEEHEVCAAAGTACLLEGQPSQGGLAYVKLKATESQLQEIIEKGGDKHKYSFIEPVLPTRGAIIQRSPYETKFWNLDRLDNEKGCDGSFNQRGTGKVVQVFFLFNGFRYKH
jgi:hypothetical protein